MTAQELIRFQIDEAGKMLRATLQGIDESTADASVGGLMSPREQVAHLCVCYMAVLDIAEGKSAQWDAYAVDSGDWKSLMETFEGLRARATEALPGDTDESLKHANDFLVGHEHYHVGQMCAVRRGIDPSWDSYQIYS